MHGDIFGVVLLVLGLVAGFLVAAALYAMELRRIARFLDTRAAGSNARLTRGASAPALAALIASINAELDRGDEARVAVQRNQQEFQRDISSLSHDIRTPLMGAKGYLQLAENEHDPELLAERLHAATERIDGTATLLDQLFSYTKASDPDLMLELERIEVQPVVERVLLGHYPEFEERSWEPELRMGTHAGAWTDESARGAAGENARTATDADECGAEKTGTRPGGATRPHSSSAAESRPSGTSGAHGFAITANEAALSRILENLVTNALRYGTDAPVLTIGAQDEREGAVLTIANRVANPGAIDTARLFDRFYQADAARGSGGAGLGLATAAKLARAMNLDLTAHLDGDVLSITLAHSTT